MRTKVKITKQQIKEDKFTTFVLQARDWILDNWQVLTIAAAAVIIVIVGVTYYLGSRTNQSAEAQQAFGRALMEMDRKNYDAAVSDFQNIVDSYGGRMAARAQFYMANTYYYSRRYDDAITAYQRYIDQYHSDKLTTSSAIAGIAACHENKGEYAQAAEKYREAIARYAESPSVPDYYLGAVRCYVQLGDKEQAEQMVAELKDTYSGSDYFRTASQLTMQLDVR
ncbi:MAG: tetratricopeptide repeat protein [candidate division Zixibacteria bacterium]|nr:tetratricopeptide repeat protein [candidate division Zixibacteria bacterium]